MIVEKASRSKVAREAARKAREAARNGKGKEKKVVLNQLNNQRNT